jgi:hypothetical protein
MLPIFGLSLAGGMRGMLGDLIDVPLAIFAINALLLNAKRFLRRGERA